MEAPQPAHAGPIMAQRLISAVSVAPSSAPSVNAVAIVSSSTVLTWVGGRSAATFAAPRARHRRTRQRSQWAVSIPRSVMTPVRCVVRTTAPDSRVTRLFCMPIAAHRMAASASRSRGWLVCDRPATKMKPASSSPSSNSAVPYRRGSRAGRGPCKIRLAESDPTKNVTASSAAKNAAPRSPRVTSMLSRPTLPVTWDVKDPINTKPPEFTNPATNARYPARIALLRSERAGPSRRNTSRRYRILGGVIAPGAASPAPALPRALLPDDLDAFDGRVVGDRRQLDGDLARRVGRGGEVAHHRLERGARAREDVEVRQDRRAVDGHVEHALAFGRLEQLGEVQADGVVRACHQAGERVGDVAVPLALVHALRRRGCHARDGDGVRHRAGRAAARELIAGERRRPAGAAGVDPVDGAGRRRDGDTGRAAGAAAGRPDRERSPGGRGRGRAARAGRAPPADRPGERRLRGQRRAEPVSYTHLTLPTI